MAAMRMTGAVPKGYQQVTSISSATGITAPAGSSYALIQVESQQVRWRDDGTNPTTSVGMILNVNDTLIYDGNFAKIMFIETTSGAKLNVSYFGEGY